MHAFLRRAFRWLAPRQRRALADRDLPLSSAIGPNWSMIDAYHRRREPSTTELMREFKNTAYTCATINASVCARFAPRLYVITRTGEPAPKCATRTIPAARAKALAVLHKAERVEEVIEHPLLTLMARVNPVHNLHDLLELTTLDQEVHGNAYWLLTYDALDRPESIWPLPAHLVMPHRAADSTRVVDYYEYRGAVPAQRFAPHEIIHFRYPHPRDPYGNGLSPLAAVYEQVALASEYVAFKTAIWHNVGLPGVIISPAEVISDAERRRLEAEWEQKFRRGGQGRALVAETGLHIDFIERSLADVALLAEQSFTKEEIANAFGVPLALLTKETNLANLQASQQQHAMLAIRPRLKRRDEKLNEQLIPRFDPTGRLFFAADDPLSDGPDLMLKREEQDLRLGVRSINEVRSERGLEPVPWGDQPWLPLAMAPTDFARRPDYGPGTGRNADPERFSPEGAD